MANIQKSSLFIKFLPEVASLVLKKNTFLFSVPKKRVSPYPQSKEVNMSLNLYSKKAENGSESAILEHPPNTMAIPYYR